MKKLFDTSLPENWSRSLLENHNMDVAAIYMDRILGVTFSSAALVLNSVKSKDYPVAFRFETANNSLVAAAVVQYFPNDDAKKPGNWSLIFTFDEKDIPEDAHEYSITDPQVHSHFRSYAIDKYRMRFDIPDALVVLPVHTLSQLYKWLDENAKEGEEVGIEQEGIFQARVAIEGGQKVFSVEPDGEVKMLIKDDASIEK